MQLQPVLDGLWLADPLQEQLGQRLTAMPGHAGSGRAQSLPEAAQHRLWPGLMHVLGRGDLS